MADEIRSYKNKFGHIEHEYKCTKCGNKFTAYRKMPNPHICYKCSRQKSEAKQKTKRINKIKAEAIDECINAIISEAPEVAKNEPYDEHLFTVMANRQHEIIDILERIKAKYERNG